MLCSGTGRVLVLQYGINPGGARGSEPPGHLLSVLAELVATQRSLSLEKHSGDIGTFCRNAADLSLPLPLCDTESYINYRLLIRGLLSQDILKMNNSRAQFLGHFKHE